MEETFICNLPIVDNGNHVQVKTTWSESNMTIAILEDKAAWKGILPYSQLSQHHHAFNISEEDHRIKCKQALSTDHGMKDFSYHLEKNVFIWKKKILTDMKIKFGHVDIHVVPIAEVCQEIMSTLISQNEAFKSKVSTYEHEINKLKRENTELIQTLEEFTDAKLREEQILYGKFTALLNTKKQRVACLEKLLFKNLCSDAEESKAISRPENNWDSDTDPEQDDSMEEPVAGPSGIRMSTIVCEDTDEEDEPPVSRIKVPVPSSGARTLSTNPSSKNKPMAVPSTSNSSPMKTKSSASMEDGNEPKKLKSDLNKMETVQRNQKLPKNVNEMDSQELLDLL